MLTGRLILNRLVLRQRGEQSKRREAGLFGMLPRQFFGMPMKGS